MKKLLLTLLLLITSCQLDEKACEHKLFVDKDITIYRDYQNTVSIFHCGYDSLQCKVKNIALEKKDNYKYLIDGNKIDLSEDTVSVYCYDMSKNVTKLKFNVEDLKPIAKVARFNIGDINKNAFSVQQGLRSMIPIFPYGDCQVTNYKFRVIRDDKIVFIELVNGTARFNKKIKEFLKNLKPDDEIIITEIAVKCINEKKYKNISSLYYKII